MKNKKELNNSSSTQKLYKITQTTNRAGIIAKKCQKKKENHKQEKPEFKEPQKKSNI